MSETFHATDPKDIAKTLGSNIEQGITSADVLSRAEKFGKNVIENAEQFSFLKALARASFEPLALILFFALGITYFLGAYVDCGVIALVLTINIGVTLFQERQSSEVFKALSETAHHRTVVIRDGVEKNIPAEEVVVGDIVVLSGGMRTPADGRLFDVASLTLNESALTGEWKPQQKTAGLLPQTTAPQDMSNMAWAGSYIVSGYGKMLVTAVGHESRFGAIAHDVLHATEEHTPLQRGLRIVSYIIIACVVAIATIIVILGVYRGEDAYTMLLTALAVSIAAIPEGLPAVMTVVLSSAMQAVHKKGGLIKRLYAAETFGSVTTILTDKTGTLTTGEMYFSGICSAKGNEKGDALSALGKEILSAAVRSSDAFIEVAEDKSVQVHGRPIEIAIVRAGLASGIDQRLQKSEGHAQQQLVQFEPTRRFAITLNDHPSDGSRIYLTGSPEQILAVCSRYMGENSIEPITKEITDYFLSEEKVAAAEGKRFTAVAYRASSERFISEDILAPDHGERLGFVFLGLLFFSDTLREGVHALVNTAGEAQIKIRIATGDHPGTALYIAEQIGLKGADYSRVLTGDQISSMTDNELRDALETTSIYARVLPENKLRIVHLLQDAGEVVAMTGDGVNDAPALTAADIGVSLSSATDIAKEASDMVLVTDDFKVIIDAVREGRRALQNIRTVLIYLLSVSLGEVLLIGGALVGGYLLPLVPVQILWANIVQEGFMSFPFALNPARGDIMKGKASPVRNVLTTELIQLVLFSSIGTGVLLFALYVFLTTSLTDIDEIRTIMFMSLSLSAILSAFCFRDVRETVITNLMNVHQYIYVSFVLSTTIFAVAIVSPLFRDLLSLREIHVRYVVIALSFALCRILFVEFCKVACGTLAQHGKMRS